MLDAAERQSLRSLCVPLLDKLLSDHDALRAAALALVEALPRCDRTDCNEPATYAEYIPYERTNHACAEHAAKSYSSYEDVEWAAPLRALSALLGGER